ncbi:MAG: non-heme iron oxygenase ferredoxin subunit [Chloroflexota bacterium]
MDNQKSTDSGKIEYILVCPVDELKNNERLYIDVDGLSMLIFNIGGNFYALADVCSHDDGPLGDGELQSWNVVCPRHGARFDVRTGEALSLPAVVDISTYPVRIRDGNLEVGIPKAK